MPFSSAVKAEALSRAGRRCVVCRRYKGLGLELHHIVPQAQGGTDDISNAAVLCFECHASAGHYNALHPRGIKFSPEKIRRSKALCESLVAQGRISDPDFVNPGIHVRYIFCADQAAANDIFSGNFDKTPFKIDRLLNTTLTGALARLAALPASDAYDLTPPDGEFGSEREWKEAVDNLEIGEFRPIRMEDLKRGHLRAPLQQRLAEGGADIGQLGYLRPQLTEPGCGPSGFWAIEVRLRTPVFVFAQVSNVDDSAITIRPVIREETGTLWSIAPLTSLGSGALRELPPLRLESNQSVAIPLGLLFAPYGGASYYGHAYDESFEFSPNQMNHVTFPAGESNAEWLTIFPNCSLEGVVVDEQQIPVHRMDPEHSYALNRVWLEGSCPHLLCRHSHKWHYVSELFISCRSEDICHEFTVGVGIDMLRVAEIEFETTWIRSIAINGRMVVEGAELHRGEWLDVAVCEGDVVVIIGSYEALGAGLGRTAAKYQKEAMLLQFMATLG